jgi:hypothetical protein
MTDPRSTYNLQFRSIFGNSTDPADINSTQLRQNFSDMFVRTAWNIVKNNGDFRAVVTTRKWQVTTAVLAALVHADKENQTPKKTYLNSPAAADLLRNLAYLTPEDYSDWRTVQLTQGSTSPPSCAPFPTMAT